MTGGIAVRLSTWDHIYRGGVQAGGNPAFDINPATAIFPGGRIGFSEYPSVYKAAFAKFVN
ncbi:MAG: hypothetical protein WDN26_19120 [Chitinophagaceae bacterium]